MSNVSPRDWSKHISKVRHFFEDKGFIECYAQNRLSILAACEDPRTIATFDYAGQIWPLPQTNQMWLEYELLSDPVDTGFFCISTSFRNEPNPIPGRHDLIFPMVEFEMKGNLDDLEMLERELLEYLGYGDKDSFPAMDYKDVAEKYGVKELDADHELQIQEDFGDAFILKHFPQYTSPFWNMKKEGDVAAKIDVIMHGFETIGSAERSTNPDEMRELFHTISDGMYADILYAKFSKERVEEELERFLSFDFFPRVGGGIGGTRMIRSLKMLDS